jgi:hypothetical protein
MNNQDLKRDLEKIKDFDPPITVAKAYEKDFDYPFGLDIEDTAYWYAEQKERDEDFCALKKEVPTFSFIDNLERS